MDIIVPLLYSNEGANVPHEGGKIYPTRGVIDTHAWGIFGDTHAWVLP